MTVLFLMAPNITVPTMTREHEFNISVFYEDTDMAGIVYYANYLRFIERARSDIARELGLDQDKMLKDGRVFAVVRVEADYLGPARLADSLVIRTTHHKLTGVRWQFNQKIYKQGRLIFKALVTVVSMTTTGRPVPLPPEIQTLN